MMQKLSTLRRFALLLGTLTWLAGMGAQQVHRIVVQHARCADHGEIIELASDETSSEVPSASVDQDAEHDHDCMLQALVGQGLSPSLIALPTPTDAPLILRARLHDAPARGPPLARAPKTGPPALA